MRALYAFAMWRTERFPLLYERVYWAVPPWVQYMSVLHSGPEIGLCMKPHVERTYINLYGPIGDVTDIDALFTGLFPAMPAWVARREPWHLRTNALGFRDQEKPPIRGGSSIGHPNGDTGTLGALVVLDDGKLCILSNNHVIAAVNAGPQN